MFRSKVKLTPVAIDPGSGALKMLQLASENGAWRVVAAGRRTMPTELRRAEERRDALADAISDLWRASGFKGRRILCAAPSAAVQFKSFRLPKMPEDEVYEVARFEAEERFALEDPDAEYRFIFAGEVRQGQDLKQEVIAMACPGEVLNGQLAVFDRLRLNCLAMDVAPCCIVRSMGHEIRDDQLNVYADIGHHATRLVVARGRSILFIKTIEVGGNRLNQLVAKSLNLAGPEAVDLRRRLSESAGGALGEDSAGDIAESVREALRPALDQLSKEIGLCMRYYAVTFRGPRPEALTCLGGESRHRELLAELSAGTGMKLTRGAPFGRVETSGVFSGAERSSQLPEWATALGLALRVASPVPKAALEVTP